MIFEHGYSDIYFLNSIRVKNVWASFAIFMTATFTTSSEHKVTKNIEKLSSQVNSGNTKE